MACKHHRDCIAICKSAGLTPIETEFRGKHFAVICMEGPVFMPSTPSDRRWRHNAISFARRLARA